MLALSSSNSTTGTSKRPPLWHFRGTTHTIRLGVGLRPWLPQALRGEQLPGDHVHRKMHHGKTILRGATQRLVELRRGGVFSRFFPGSLVDLGGEPGVKTMRSAL